MALRWQQGRGLEVRRSTCHSSKSNLTSQRKQRSRIDKATVREVQADACHPPRCTRCVGHPLLPFAHLADDDSASVVGGLFANMKYKVRSLTPRTSNHGSPV